MNTARFIALGVTVSTIAACSAAPSEGVGRASARVTAAACSAAPAWAAGVSYLVGELVSYDGVVYQCIQAHTSEPGWTPAAVPALWEPAGCSGGGGSSSGGGGSSGSGSGSGSSSGSGSGSGSGGSSCNAAAWVFMGTNANACDGNVGESCGWTASNEGQGYHCAATSWGTGCEPGGATCGGGSGSSSGGGSSSGSSSGSSGSSSGGGGAFTQSFSTWYCGDACGSNDTGSCGTTYCGTQVSPTVLGAALSQIRMNGPSGTYMGGGLCGQQIEIVALDTGRSVTIPVIDACEACNADDHVDLTLGVWNALGEDPCAGRFNQEWRFVN